MSNDERSLLPGGTAPRAQVGQSSRLIARGIDRLTRTEFGFAELPAEPSVICRTCAVNNRGQVAGFVRWSDELTQAVVWDHGRMIPLATDPSMNSRAFDINDRGQAVGVEYLAEVGGPSDELAESTAVLWDSGKKVALEVPDGRNESQAFSINEIGQIVGVLHDWKTWRTDEVRAVLWHNGHRLDLPTLPREVFNIGHPASDGMLAEPYDGAFAINNQGTIVGYSAANPVVWERDEVRELDLPECGYFPWERYARGINDHGQIVGTVWPNAYEPAEWTGLPQAVLWDKEYTLIVGAIGEQAKSPSVWLQVPYPRINNRGQIVGLRTSTNPNAVCLWEGGRLIELVTPTGGASYATDINDLGQVVGCFERSDGVWRACQWG